MKPLRIVCGIFLCVAPFPHVRFVQQQCAKIGYCVGAVVVMDARLGGKLAYDEAVAL